MFVEGFAVELVAKDLRLVDLFSLRASSNTARTVCSEETLWAAVLFRELDGLGLSPALLKPAGWSSLAPLFREFQRARVTVDGSAGVHIGQATVQKLTRTLQVANRSLSFPWIFVSGMRFPQALLAVALEDRHQLRDRNIQPQLPSCIGDTVPLYSCLVDAPAMESSAAACLPGSKNPHGLTLHLGWLSGCLHVTVRNDGLNPPELVAGEDLDEFHDDIFMDNQRGLRLVTLDFAACSAALTLQYRGVQIVVNGAWTICNTGFFTMTAGKAAAVDALSVGVPCIVCVRNRQASMRSSSIAAALHLESFRR